MSTDTATTRWTGWLHYTPWEDVPALLAGSNYVAVRKALLLSGRVRHSTFVISDQEPRGGIGHWLLPSEAAAALQARLVDTVATDVLREGSL